MRKTISILLSLGVLAATIWGSSSNAADYEPTWKSLKSAPVPEWIMDAKFGIYTHWGVYSVPAFQTNVYGQEMYVHEGAKRVPKRGMAIRRYHEANYGSIVEFGYKDFVPMFTAPKFDAAEWAQVMKDGGVGFAGICLVHHDGFCLWDSEFTRWDSMDMGPKRDIYGELATEIRKRDMKLLATFHHARTYGHHTNYASQFPDDEKAKLDVFDPQYDDLYRNPETVSKEEFGTEWQSKINEVIRKYRPDAIWFDGLSGQIAASWRFQKLEASQGDAVRLTRSKDCSSLFAFVIGQPESGSVTIKTLRKGNVDKQGQGIKSVSLLGSDAKIDWKQATEGLTIRFPEDLPCEVAYGFKITTNSGRVDDAPREHLDDPIERKGDWPVFRSTR